MRRAAGPASPWGHWDNSFSLSSTVDGFTITAQDLVDSKGRRPIVVAFLNP